MNSVFKEYIGCSVFYSLCLSFLLINSSYSTHAKTIKNEQSGTYAHGGYFAGAIDVSFGSKPSVDAQNFDKGQANAVAQTCGLVRSSEQNGQQANAASAHDLNGPGGSAGRVSDMNFLAPGTSGKESDGKFCLYKDSSNGIWTVQRDVVGSKANDPGAGIKSCTPTDLFSPELGCNSLKLLCPHCAGAKMDTATAYNPYSKTYARGAYHAGAIDVSFGTKPDLNAQAFDMGKAVDVPGACGLIKSAGDPLGLNELKSTPASAHDVGGKGGASGQVSSLSFLQTGASDQETKGKFCLIKDASGGYWALERDLVGSSSVAELRGMMGITPCAASDVFNPANGCKAAEKKMAMKLPDNKTMVGTIARIEQGDRACYVDVTDDSGAKTTQLADFSFCEKNDLIGKKVELKLQSGNVLALSCDGNVDCGKSDRVMLIKQIKLISKNTSYAPVATCMIGSCDTGGSNIGYKHCLSKKADQQDEELTRLWRKVRTSMKKRDKTVRKAFRSWSDFYQSHKKWQKFRDATCDIEYSMAEGGTAGGGYTSSCLCNLSYHRNLDLKRLLANYLE